MAEYFQIVLTRTIASKEGKRGIVTKIKTFKKIESDDPVMDIVEQNSDMLDIGFTLTWKRMSRAEFLRKSEDSCCE